MLQDLVQQLRISDRFTLRHPRSGARSLPAPFRQRLQQQPASVQALCLTMYLRDYLYENYFLRGPAEHSADDLEALSDDSAIEPNGAIEAFRDRLDRSNSGQGYWQAGWTVLGQRSDGFIAVRRDGITLDVHPQQELPVGLRKLKVNQKISIKLPHNRIEPGAYIAIGDCGPVESPSPGSRLISSSTSQSAELKRQSNQQLNLYFNLQARAAAQLMERITQALNGVAIAFDLAMPNHPKAYNRPDSAILSIYCRDWPQIAALVQPIAQQLHEEQSLRKATLPLTQPWLPGVSLAEEPSRAASARENFGLHRCYAIAQGLLKAETLGQGNDQAARLAHIQTAFEQWNIRWDLPHLNIGSEMLEARPH